MSDTPSSPVPDYNTQERSKFDPVKLLKEPDGSYSTFWPLVFVFAALIILFIHDVSYLRYRKLILTEQLSQLSAGQKAIKEQRNFTESLYRDMATLAPGHPQVATLLNQYFPDRVSNPPAGGAASTPPPPK